MNDMNDTNQQDLDRLSRQLRAAAGELPLRPGSELATVRTAHRRHHRRRNLTAAATVVAVAGGTTVAIQQLGKASPGDIGTADQPGDGTTEVALAPAEPANDEVSAAVPTTTEPADPYAAIADKVVPAVRAESNYVWNVVTPEAANAVYGRFDGQVPGVIVSTAPGRADINEYPQRALYHTDDGITFERLDATPPSGFLRNVVADGDRVYSVGTAPGIARSAPNPLLVEWSPDRGETWESIELPVDTQAHRDLPMVKDHGNVSAVPFSGGAVVVVESYVDLDHAGLPSEVRYSGRHAIDGVLVEDGPCAPDAAPTITAPTITVPATSAEMTPEEVERAELEAQRERIERIERERVDGDAGCSTRVIAWEELGVPAESVEALMSEQQSRAFRIVDGVVEEISIPDEVDILLGDGRGGLVGYTTSYVDGNRHLEWIGAFDVDDHGELIAQARNELDQMWGGLELATDGRRFTDIGSPDGRGQILASTDGADWTYADTDALYRDFDYSFHVHAAASDDSYIAAAVVQRDPIAERGGVTVEVDGIVLERQDARSPMVARDATTGELVSDEVWIEGYDTPSGDVQYVVSGLAEGLAPDITAEDWRTLHGDDGVANLQRWVIETTADGVHIASESVAELLGVTDDEISSIARITADGRQVIVAVTLQAENPDGSKIQQLLVGTPKA